MTMATVLRCDFKDMNDCPLETFSVLTTIPETARQIAAWMQLWSTYWDGHNTRDLCPTHAAEIFVLWIDKWTIWRQEPF